MLLCLCWDRLTLDIDARSPSEGFTTPTQKLIGSGRLLTKSWYEPRSGNRGNELWEGRLAKTLLNCGKHHIYFSVSIRYVSFCSLFRTVMSYFIICLTLNGRLFSCTLPQSGIISNEALYRQTFLWNSTGNWSSLSRGTIMIRQRAHIASFLISV